MVDTADTAWQSLDLQRHVLVVDDSEAFRRLVRFHLRNEGIRITEAGEGGRGLQLARSERPDLILLDVHMPNLGGFEAIHLLKEDPLTRSIPVIFVSCTDDGRDKARGLDLGAVDFVSKPVDPVELRARVRAALRTKFLQDLLEQRAHLDGLTGLGNRIALQERIRSAWAACRRRGCPLSLWIADLDHFKQINDQHGHHTGDEVLIQSARLLRKAVREMDFVARYGGEEFVVVAPDCPLAGAAAMAERFREELELVRCWSIAAPQLAVTVSVGVASAFEPDLVSPDSLLRRADFALYDAKRAGRNAIWSWQAGDSAEGDAGRTAPMMVPAGLPPSSSSQTDWAWVGLEFTSAGWSGRDIEMQHAYPPPDETKPTQRELYIFDQEVRAAKPKPPAGKRPDSRTM